MNKKIILALFSSVGMITGCTNKPSDEPDKPIEHSHVDVNHDGKCDVCEEEVPVNHTDANHDHLCDVCDAKISEHSDTNPKDHLCDECGAKMSEHSDLNRDHECDYCGEKISTHADTNNDHNCDVCGEPMSEHVDANKDHNCDVCGEVMSKHSDGNDDGFCDYCEERIKDPVVESVTMLPASMNLEVGQNGSLTAIVSAKYGASVEVSWKSSNDNVATVDKDGKVTAVGAGEATISAISVSNPSKYAVCEIRVTNPEEEHKATITSVTVSPKSGSIEEGKTIKLEANVLGQYDYSKDVIWSSSDNSIATVSNLGVVSGHKAGTVTITATSAQDSTKSDTATIEVTQATPEKNDELDKFNELISSIKTKHNYTMSISSVVEGYDDVDNYYDNITNYNNLVLEGDDLNYGLDGAGIIYQKDQGYVNYLRDGTKIIADSFAATDPSLKISDFNIVVAENLFNGNFEQDSNDKAMFVTENLDSIAVACQFTGFGDYVDIGVLQADTSMSAKVDLDNDTLTIEFNYWLMYFDEVEHHDAAKLTIVISDIGEVKNDTFDAYLEDPSCVFEAPTEWSSDDKEAFDTKFNSNYPTMPEGLTYAYHCGLMYYDGFEYATVEDLNSGDLTDAYATQLLSEGYTKSGTNTYKKVVDGANPFEKITYTVILKYYESSICYPNGMMYFMFRSQNDVGVFSSIDEFNAMLSAYKYDELVPLLPASSSVTKINNVKDQTSGSSSFALKMNSTDTLHVWIENYNDAKAFYDLYASLLIAKGYSEVQSGLGAMHNYGLETSTSGSYVGLDFPDDKNNYVGWVGIRYNIYKADEASLRPAPAATLDHISVSEMSTTYQVGDPFSFDGICTAYFSDETSKQVTPTYVSSPDMTTTGEKTIVVKYSESGVEKQTSYKINVSEAAAKPVSLAISGFYSTQFLKDGYFNHAGMCVTVTYSDFSTKIVSSSASFEYDLSEAGIKPVTVSYTEDGVTVSDTYNILVSENSYKWPSLSMAENEDVSLEGFMNLDYDSITNFNYNNAQSFLVEINTVAEIEQIYIDEDPDAIITLDSDYGGGYKDYLITPSKTLDMSSYTLVVVTKALTKYNVSVTDSIEHGSLNLDGLTKAPAGAEVDIYCEADDGYEIDTISAVGHPELSIQWYDYGGFYWFVMPAYDVQLTATFKEKADPHSVAGAGAIYDDGGTKMGTVSKWFKYESVVAGEMAYVTITPEKGYEIVRAYVEGHEEITLSDASASMGSNKWGFVMPNYDVVITAEFRLIPKELDSISLSGQTADFTVGSDFSTGSLVVTANYLNGEKATVTNYDIDDSKVDMSKVGTYPVTISYTEGGVTKTASYNITVKAGDVSCSVYSGSITISKVEYTYKLTIYEDGTGTYELSNGATTYHQYFTWTNAGSGKISIVPDANKTSELCKTTSCYANLWFYWSGDSKSNQNVITLDGTTASFPGMYHNNTSAHTITLTLVSE